MGVFGTSGQLPLGTPFSGGHPAGVVGNSVDTSGVWGESLNSIGVVGRSASQTQNPDDDVAGVRGISLSPLGNGVDAYNIADGGVGVLGSVGKGDGVYGSSKSNGNGVFGINSDSFFYGPATGAGVYGLSEGNSNNSYGVKGESPNVGVYGYSPTGQGVQGYGPRNVGVDGVTDGVTDSCRGVSGTSYLSGTGVFGGCYDSADLGSATGIGVDGYSDASYGTGVRGNCPSGTGVQGHSKYGVGVQGSSDEHAGVRGESFEGEGVVGTSTYGNGVGGLSWTATGVEGTSIIGYGVTGYSFGSVDREDPPGAGVLGHSNRDPGVIGESNFGSGVVGYSGSGYAGEFFGDVRIAGNLYLQGQLVHYLHAGPAQHKIDHPTDPANRYLNHSSIASPEMKNVYDGVVELDEAGAARVELPEWFAELNQDFRYQLTPIGASAPGLYVAQEIADNLFEIAGGEPSMKVSWQVTGVLQDRWVAGRFEVEQDKPLEERGRYLRPELFGQPQEDRIGTDPSREEQLQQIRERLEQQPPPRLPSVALAADQERVRRVQELTREVVGQEPLPADEHLFAQQALPSDQPHPPQQPPSTDRSRLEQRSRQDEEILMRLRESSTSETQE
jgi:hypothetical protein